jgi:hypothetical protein
LTVSSLYTKVRRMDSDSEQMFHDLEQRHVLLRKEHDVVCIEREAFKGDHNIASTVRDDFELLWMCLGSKQKILHFLHH